MILIGAGQCSTQVAIPGPNIHVEQRDVILPGIGCSHQPAERAKGNFRKSIQGMNCFSSLHTSECGHIGIGGDEVGAGNRIILGSKMIIFLPDHCVG